MIRYFFTSTGKKYLMAISGLALFGFIVMHLVGNLRIFFGPESLNRYAALLRTFGEFFWAARLGLIALTGVHILTAVSLTLENRAARPQAYANRTYIKASYASRTMYLSGFIVLAFLLYHIAHFTLHIVHPQLSHALDAQGRPDVYRMVVLSFQQPLITLLYIVANLLLGAHMSHGLYSMLQSLGILHESVRSKWRMVAQAIGYSIFLGYASIPLSVWLGIVK